MKKVNLLLLITLFIAVSCSKKDEVDTSKTIKNTSWYRPFSKEEIKRSLEGVMSVDLSVVKSIDVTYNIIDDANFQVDIFVGTTQVSVSQKYKGTYTYNSNNGEVIFNYIGISIFGKVSDRGVINGNRMTFINKDTKETLTFKKK